METLEYNGVGYVLATDLARERGTTRQAVYIAIKQGRLPFVPIAGRKWIPADAAANWFPTPHGGGRTGAGRPVTKKAEVSQ